MSDEPTPPAASAPPAAPEGDAPPPLPGMTRAQWIAVILGFVGFLGLAGVLLAREDGARGAAHAAVPPAPAAAPTHGTAGEPEPGPGAPYDLPQAPSDDGGCGPLDPDHPPQILFLFEGEEVDLGDLKQGVLASQEVQFKNIGSGPLCVTKVQTGCGCIKATLLGDSKRFEPGETGTIRLAADTTGRVGLVHKQVTMFTNDIKHPQRSFRVKLNVSAGLVVEPRYLQFGSLPPKTPATQVLYLRAPKDAPVWGITGVRSVRSIAGREPVAYDFRVEEVPDPNYYKLRLHITHPGYDQVGAVRDVLLVSTTWPDRKQFEVPAHISVVDRIRCRSRSISLGFVQTGAARVPTRARIEGGSPRVVFAITSVEITAPGGAAPGAAGPGFEATFGKDDRGWWVDVRYDGKSRAAGLLEAELRVHTDDPQQPLVIVPVRATVRDPD